MDELGSGNALFCVIGDGDVGATCCGALACKRLNCFIGPQMLWRDDADVSPHNCAHDEQGIAHVVTRVANICVGDFRAGGVLTHGEEVGEHLGRMPVIGESVVDRHPRVAGEFLDVGVVSPSVLDPVEQLSEHPRRVGHRLLVPNLRG